MADNVVEAAHLFRREPAPEVRDTWDWFGEYVNGGGVLNLVAIVDDMTNADSEESFLAAARQLRAEVGSYPDLEER